MKRLLFISKSLLSFNLMKASLALLPFEVEAVYQSVPSPLIPLPQGEREIKNLSDREKFDLIIIDANVLKDNPSGLQNLKTPAILIHTQDFTGDREALKKSGFAGFYTKPFLVEEWVEIIRSSIVRSKETFYIPSNDRTIERSN